ncbi:hypothetical protein BDA99DRAFT_22587 [Phascolomyces articulosus]|uniref:Uncharacterized protein n=1 Tax=Phascolomyces articulosus TaxID=60185 RepID=A0AAD5K295_9FUNG|nr:hypothetical protein BDA99DRAFT_22587 [Phascolomyces articulosus]
MNDKVQGVENNNSAHGLTFTLFDNNSPPSSMASSSLPFHQKPISEHDSPPSSSLSNLSTATLRSPFPVCGTVGSSVKTGCGDGSPQNIVYDNNDNGNHCYNRNTSQQLIQCKEEEEEEHFYSFNSVSASIASSTHHPLSSYPSDTITIPIVSIYIPLDSSGVFFFSLFLSSTSSTSNPHLFLPPQKKTLGTKKNSFSYIKKNCQLIFSLYFIPHLRIPTNTTTQMPSSSTSSSSSSFTSSR